jgi:non-ribosomal peptide synthetase component F
MALAQINAFVDILESVLSNQAQTITDAIRVGPRQLSQLWEWNKTVPPTIDVCMHDIISELARQNPERMAVTSWDGEMSYGTLERLSSQLAVRLAELGVRVGVIVPLCFEKSMWTVVGVLAVMKAGGAFVLTDPHQPEARLQIIAQEVGAKVVLTSKAQAELGARIAPDAQVVAIGSELLESKEHFPVDVLPRVPSSAILYIIFTSGKLTLWSLCR